MASFYTPNPLVPEPALLGAAMTHAVHDSVLTIDDLASYLKIAKSTLYKLAQEGKLPGQKVGRHWRFHREAVDRWLKKHHTTSENSLDGE